MNRRTKITTAVATVAAVGVAGGVAWALYSAAARVTGGGTSGEFVASWVTAAGAASGAADVYPASTATVVTAPSISGGTLTLPADASYFPGDELITSAKIKVTGSRSGYVSGVTLPGLPKGYTATLTQGCGTVITTATPQPIGLRITRDAAGAAVAGSWSISAPTAGVLVTAADLPAGGASAVTCAPYAGTA